MWSGRTDLDEAGARASKSSHGKSSRSWSHNTFRCSTVPLSTSSIASFSGSVWKDASFESKPKPIIYAPTQPTIVIKYLVYFFTRERSIDFKFDTIFRIWNKREIRLFFDECICISLKGRTILRELFLRERERLSISSHPFVHTRTREFYVGVKLAETHACVPFRSINVFRLDFRFGYSLNTFKSRLRLPCGKKCKWEAFFVIHFEGKIIVHFVFAVHVSNRIFHKCGWSWICMRELRES